jgi:predicted TIM-barrel fold metal-dependent hydrolase
VRQGFKAIDAEIHLEEPFDLWERKLDEPFRSRTHIEGPPEGHRRAGATRFIYNGRVMADTGRTPMSQLLQQQSIDRSSRDPRLAEAQTNCSPPVYLEGMDLMGIDVAILMPTTTILALMCDDFDPHHALAMCQVYNNWAHEFASASPERFRFWAWLPRQDATLAATELKRCVTELGAIGGSLPTHSVDDHLLSDPFFEPLWQEFNRLRVPLGFHVSSSADSDNLRGRYSGHPEAAMAAATIAGPYYGMTTFAELIFGGVLERYPNIKPVVMELNASWVPWMLWRFDDRWETFSKHSGSSLSMKPSNYFRRQCYAVMDPTETVARYCVDYGIEDNLLISTDYPHHDAPFPDGIDTLLGLEGVDEAAKRKILWDNGAELFGLESRGVMGTRAADEAVRPEAR